MRHLMHLERSVYVGGWRLWPSRLRVGGRWYTVGPLSLLRWVQFGDATAALGTDSAGLLKFPRLYVAPLAPLILSPAPRPRDLKRITDAQAMLVMQALAECNDFPYLTERVAEALAEARKVEEGAKKADGWTMLDAVDFLVEQRPCYTHEQVKNLPAQAFYAIMQSIAKKVDSRNRAEAGGREEDAPALTPGQLRQLAAQEEARLAKEAEGAV